MKNSWKRILAVAAILALALCVLSGCSDNTQAKIDEAVKTATDAAAKEKDEAVAAIQATLDEANASVEAAKAEVTELTEKLAAAEEAAKTAAEAAAKEKDEAVAAAKAELESQVADLTAKLTAAEEAAKTAAENAAKEKDEAVAAAKAEAEAEIAELTEKLAAAEEAAKNATDAAVEDAGAAAKEAQDAADATIKDLQGKLETAEKDKADLEAKVADLEKQIASAAEEVTEEVVETVEQAEEKVEEAAAAEAAAEEPAAEEPAAEEPAAEEAAVMSHEDFAAAELDTEVTVETYVQATQSWWDNKITVYAQSEDGAYFIYNMACSEEDAAKLTAGAKIRVKGFKSEWAGEVEITDATFELIDGEAFIAEPTDVTDLLGKDELIAHQNEKVLFKGLTVAAQDDGAAFNYKNAENKTDDLYVRFTKDDLTLNFCVEFYLCGNDTEVYKAVEGLQVGDVVDVEGFLYWYEGVNTHMTAVIKAE